MNAMSTLKTVLREKKSCYRKLEAESRTGLADFICRT